MLRIIAAGVIIASSLLAPSASQAGLYSFFANLDGPSESPPNASPGTGTTLTSNGAGGIVEIDHILRTQFDATQTGANAAADARTGMVQHGMGQRARRQGESTQHSRGPGT